MRSRPITILWRWPATDHKPHCRHVPINKIWRQTNSTPQTGWRRSHMAGIYGNCSTREINTCFVLLARPGSPTDKLWDNCNRLYRGKCQNPTEQTNFSTAFGMFSYRRKVTENVLQSLSTQPILSFCQWLAHLIISSRGKNRQQCDKLLLLFRECCSSCRFQPCDCIIICFVE